MVVYRCSLTCPELKKLQTHLITLLQNVQLHCYFHDFIFTEDGHKMSLEGTLKTKLLLQECHFTWSLREEEDFVLYDLLNRLEEQIQLESDEERVTRAYSSLGFVQYIYGHQQEALANLQKSVQLAKEYYKDSDEVLIVTFGDLAWLHYHMNEFSKCEDYLRELERIRRKFSEGFTYDVEVLREKGWTFLKFSYKYYNAAKECFRQALEMKPDDSDLNSGYAIVMFRTANENSESLDSPTIKQLKRAIELDPDDAVLLMLLALTMLRNRDDGKIPETAKRMVAVALMKSPENPHVIRYAAKFCRQLGNMHGAISLLEEALQSTPNSAFIHHQLALCYKSTKIFLEKKNRTQDKAGFDFEESYEKQQYLDQCIEHLEKAVSLKPSFVVATADLALHYGQRGSFEEAEIFFEKAFKMANKEKHHLPNVHCLYGNYQLYTRRSEELAIHHFMQGLRLQPKSEQGKVCEEKLKAMIEHRLNRLKNPDGIVCGIQGFIHEVKGEKLKAEEFYERALTNGLSFGDSPLLTEMRIWLMRFSETEKSVLNLIFDKGNYDEAVSGRLKTFKGAMNKKTVHLVDIDICNAKRILRWEKPTLGPHAILLAFSLHNDRFTDQTKEIVENLKFLGEKFWTHVIVVFTEGDSCITAYSGAQRRVLEWLLEKCGHKSYICGYAPETTERIELSERIQRMIKRNNSMHLVLPDISDGDSQSTLDILRKQDLKDYLFTPEVIVQEGKYRLRCNHAGWFHCKFTQIGFNMEGEGEVLYRTVLQDSDCPVPANYYQAGPVYDIKCVQGELSQLRLPHCETSIDAHHFISVIHYSNQMVDILKLQNITSTHATVSIPGTSYFFISKIANWFTGDWSKTHGQVMLFYLQQAHRLHVFLKPRNVDPREVEKCNKDYTLIQTACECMLKYECVYSMSCDPVEEHGPSVRPKIQPMDTKLHCTKQWKHYYPTFDIKLPDGVMDVGLHLKKKNPRKGRVDVVWSSDITLTDYTAENRRPSLSTDEQCASFLKKNKAKLIQKVKNIDAILDHFEDIIADEQIEEIRKMSTPQNKMRTIFKIIEGQGLSSKRIFFDLLYQEERHLMDELTKDNN
ncbi:interferon-induced protein with tetratricopeptide repeats 5 isoform X2 [Carassius gibelio]|uniref:interferon-induced protein with tetratricopeptide repeats 5 isoform X2 n=1 Tax=Carassius gibelio TaxID=101364 RepID=UPI00227937DE|nr:interferon-induced protein with tetratricopeptide repeats 5 isoform X2 [Carassius gibelio]